MKKVRVPKQDGLHFTLTSDKSNAIAEALRSDQANSDSTGNAIAYAIATAEALRSDKQQCDSRGNGDSTSNAIGTTISIAEAWGGDNQQCNNKILRSSEQTMR